MANDGEWRPSSQHTGAMLDAAGSRAGHHSPRTVYVTLPDGDTIILRRRATLVLRVAGMDPVTVMSSPIASEPRRLTLGSENEREHRTMNPRAPRLLGSSQIRRTAAPLY